MRRCLAILFCVLFLCQCSAQEAVLHDSEQQTIPLSSLQGKWLILNYWADWCDACRREVPQLNAFYRKHKGEVQLLGVNFDQLASKRLRLAVRRLNFEFPVILENPAQFWPVKTPQILPTTVIVGPDGRIRVTLTGEQTEESLDQSWQKVRQAG